jgi:hypothetical protein
MFCFVFKKHEGLHINLQKGIEEALEIFGSCRVFRVELDGKDGQLVVREALVRAVVGVREQAYPVHGS